MYFVLVTIATLAILEHPKQGGIQGFYYFIFCKILLLLII